MGSLEERQEAARATLQKQHLMEIEKFRMWVEAEILNACHQAPPEPYEYASRPGKVALNSSACEYFLKQRYGNDIFIDRSKNLPPPDAELVRMLLVQKNSVLQRQTYESDALRAAQLLEWEDEHGQPYAEPDRFPQVPVNDLSLEDMTPDPHVLE